MENAIETVQVQTMSTQYLLGMLPRIAVFPYFTIACFTWHSYDWILCFEREWEMLWTRRRIFAATLYYSIRISATIFQAFDFFMMIVRTNDGKLCDAFFYQIAINTMFLICCVETLLQARINALYNGFKPLFYFNAFFFLVALGSSLAVLGRELPSVHTLTTPAPIEGCWANIPRQVALCLVPPAVFEGWLFLLVLRKVVQEYTWQRRVFTGKTIALVVVRDCVLWFMMGGSCLVAYLFTFMYAPAGYHFLGVAVFHSAICVWAGRMILSVRTALKPDENPSDPVYVSTAIGIFAAPEEAVMSTTMDFSPEMNDHLAMLRQLRREAREAEMTDLEADGDEIVPQDTTAGGSTP